MKFRVLPLDGTSLRLYPVHHHRPPNDVPHGDASLPSLPSSSNSSAIPLLSCRLYAQDVTTSSEQFLGHFTFSTAPRAFRWGTPIVPPTLLDCEEVTEENGAVDDGTDDLAISSDDWPVPLDPPPCGANPLIALADTYSPSPWAACSRVLQILASCAARQDSSPSGNFDSQREPPVHYAMTINEHFSNWRVFPSVSSHCSSRDLTLMDTGSDVAVERNFLPDNNLLVDVGNALLPLCPVTPSCSAVDEETYPLHAVGESAACGLLALLPQLLPAWRGDLQQQLPTPILTFQTNHPFCFHLLQDWAARKATCWSSFSTNIGQEGGADEDAVIPKDVDDGAASSRHDEIFTMLAVVPTALIRENSTRSDVQKRQQHQRREDGEEKDLLALRASSVERLFWRIGGPPQPNCSSDWIDGSAALTRKLLPSNVASGSQLLQTFDLNQCEMFRLPPKKILSAASATNGSANQPHHQPSEKKTRPMKVLQLIRHDTNFPVADDGSSSSSSSSSSCSSAAKKHQLFMAQAAGRVAVRMMAIAAPPLFFTIPSPLLPTSRGHCRQPMLLEGSIKKAEELAFELRLLASSLEESDETPPIGALQQLLLSNDEETSLSSSDLYLPICCDLVCNEAEAQKEEEEKGDYEAMNTKETIRCFDNGILVDRWEIESDSTEADLPSLLNLRLSVSIASWAGATPASLCIHLSQLQIMAQILCSSSRPLRIDCGGHHSSILQQQEEGVGGSDATAVVLSCIPFSLWHTMWSFCQSVAAEGRGHVGVIFLVPVLQDARTLHKLFHSCADWNALEHPLYVAIATVPFADCIVVSPAAVAVSAAFHASSEHVVTCVVLLSSAVAKSAPEHAFVPCAVATADDAARQLTHILSSPAAATSHPSRSLLLITDQTSAKLWSAATTMLTPSSSRLPLRAFAIEGNPTTCSTAAAAAYCHILAGSSPPAEDIFLKIIERFVTSVVTQLQALVASYQSVFGSDMARLLMEKDARALCNAMLALHRQLLLSSSSFSSSSGGGGGASSVVRTVEHAASLSQALVLLADVEDSIAIDGIRITVELLHGVMPADHPPPHHHPAASSSPDVYFAAARQQHIYSLSLQILDAFREAWVPAKHTRSHLDVEKVVVTRQWLSDRSAVYNATKMKEKSDSSARLASFHALILCATRTVANAVSRSLAAGPASISSSSTTTDAPFAAHGIAIGFCKPEKNGEVNLGIVSGFHCAAYECVVLWETLEARVVPPLFTMSISTAAAAANDPSPHFVLSSIAELRDCAQVLSFREHDGGFGSAAVNRVGFTAGSIFPAAACLLQPPTVTSTTSPLGVAPGSQFDVRPAAYHDDGAHHVFTSSSVGSVTKVLPTDSTASAQANLPAKATTAITVKTRGPLLPTFHHPSISSGRCRVAATYPGLPAKSMACIDEQGQACCLVFDRYVFNLLVKSGPWLAERNLTDEASCLQQFLHHWSTRTVLLLIDVDNWNDLEMEAVEAYTSHLREASSGPQGQPTVRVEYISGADGTDDNCKLIQILLDKIVTIQRIK